MNVKRLAQTAESVAEEVDKWLVTDKNSPINISKSDVPILVDCLKQHANTMLQFKAVWALANIASTTSELTNLVVGAGAVPILIQLLSSTALNICEQAVLCLGNIIGEAPWLRNLVIQHGVVPPLLVLSRRDIPISALRNVAWVIVNICRYNNQPPPATSIPEILSVLNVLMDHTDTAVLGNSTWAIFYLSEGGNNQMQMITESGVVPKLVPLLGQHNLRKMPVLRAIDKILAGSYEQTQAVLNCDVMSYFPALLIQPKQNVREMAFWCLSSIISTNPLQLLTIIGPFCDLLTCQDINLIKFVLDGLNNLLQVAGTNLQHVVSLIKDCNGLGKIEILRGHSEVEIYPLAFEIIEKYFSQTANEDI